jgi:hypothetical protein
VFVDVPSSTLKDSCSPYRLLDPSGKQVNSGCNINGAGYIDRTELAADGQYTVQLDPRAELTGRAVTRVYLAQDVNAPIEPNGAPISAAIAQPGAVARYRFTGTAGQRVFVDVPESTLPDQCSPLELRDPAGKQIGSGCVINGIGDIEGPVLPADGVYTVEIDPRDRAVGNFRVQLFAAKEQTETIAVNGQPVVATIGQPGFVTRYQFTGTAGTTVSLSATDATLPDQCSPLKLLDPSGKQIDSGCVINGDGGIDKARLPATGTYTIVVDPSGSGTGTVTLTLRR